MYTLMSHPVEDDTTASHPGYEAVWTTFYQAVLARLTAPCLTP